MDIILPNLKSLIEARDEVVEKWAVSNNPTLILGILGTYWIFVKKVGPKWMEGRKPYNPKHFVMFYNLLQVSLNIGMVLWVSSTLSICSVSHLFLYFCSPFMIV